MATPPYISEDGFRTPRELSGREMAAKRKAVEETPIPGPGASSSTSVWQTVLKQPVIAQTADELAKSNERLFCENANTRVQGMNPNNKERGDLQSFMKQKRSRKEGEKTDRSQGVRISTEFFQQHAEEKHLDELRDEDSLHRRSDTYDEDSKTIEQQIEVEGNDCKLFNSNAVIDAPTKDGQTDESTSDYVNFHAVRETTIDGVRSGVGHVVVMEKLDTYLKPTKVCMEAISGMSAPKFNNEQCAYLFEKLRATVESEDSFLAELKGKPNEIFSTTDMKRWTEIFKRSLVSANQIQSLYRDCGKDDWIQSALTLAHVEEYVCSVGLSLEFCKVAIWKEQGVADILMVDEVCKLNEIEMERVKFMALVDAKYLILKARAVASSSKMAQCLLDKLGRDVEVPYFDDDDDLSHCTTLFEWVSLLKEKKIGGGSQAKVYRVKWLGTFVAKKTFDGPNNEEFWREAKVLSRLHHPNITSMFCCSMDERECSIIMELMDGNLYDLLRKRRKKKAFHSFSDLEGVDLMLQVGEGVNYLHEKNIEHRDLKSANILVKRRIVTTGDVEYIQAKVVDFGLSKTKESSISFSTMTNKGGTSRWMAPEIIRCIEGTREGRESSQTLRKYNFKGDIYSLGMVFMEILTGEVPFQSERSERDIRKMVLDGMRPTLPRNCSPRLAKLIERCWSQAPEQRPRISDVCLELKYLKYSLLTSVFSQGCSSLSMGGPYAVEDKKDRERKGVREYRYSEVETALASMVVEWKEIDFIKSGYSKLSSGEEVTIYVVENQQGIWNFAKFMDILSKVHHKNVMSLVGFCSVEQKLVLIYEFMDKCNSLSNIVFEVSESGIQDWKTLINIGLQVATGLEYLHTECNPSLIHGDVNPENICINSKNEAKLFGLESFISGVCLQRHVQKNEYLDPEYEVTKTLSTKSDVYSFGVVLLQLTTGQYYSGVDLDIMWSSLMYGLNVHTAVRDRNSLSCISNMDSLRKFLEVVMSCVELLSDQRPSMSEVVRGLRYALELEENPSMHNPTDLAPLLKNKAHKLWKSPLKLDPYWDMDMLDSIDDVAD